LREAFQWHYSTQCQSVFLVDAFIKKKDGSWSLCVDYHHLNDITIMGKYWVPVIKELLDE
jgi:hypothetical protein